jgi:hypothetical protein
MAHHAVYRAIVSAVTDGTLGEPFTNGEFRTACPGFGGGTYNAFLDKRSLGNPGSATELFDRVAPDSFNLVRPLKTGWMECSLQNWTPFRTMKRSLLERAKTRQAHFRDAT